MTERCSPMFYWGQILVLSCLYRPYGDDAGPSIAGLHHHPSISPPMWRKLWQLFWGKGSWPNRIIPWATSSSAQRILKRPFQPELLMDVSVWVLRMPWTLVESRSLHFTEKFSCPDISCGGGRGGERGIKIKIIKKNLFWTSLISLIFHFKLQSSHEKKNQ